MATIVRLEFVQPPDGLTEIIQGTRGSVQAIAGEIAARATGMTTEGAGFKAEVKDEPRYQDASYGATRPVGVVVPADDDSNIEGARKHILARAMG